MHVHVITHTSPIMQPSPTNPPKGYPPVEPVKASDAKSRPTDAAGKTQALKDSMREVVTSWRTWLLALTYFMVRVCGGVMWVCCSVCVGDRVHC
jgi:hypothetical protein